MHTHILIHTQRVKDDCIRIKDDSNLERRKLLLRHCIKRKSNLRFRSLISSMFFIRTELAQFLPWMKFTDAVVVLKDRNGQGQCMCTEISFSLYFSSLSLVSLSPPSQALNFSLCLGEQRERVSERERERVKKKKEKKRRKRKRKRRHRVASTSVPI